VPTQSWSGKSAVFFMGERSDVPRLQQVEQKAVGRRRNLGLVESKTTKLQCLHLFIFCIYHVHCKTPPYLPTRFRWGTPGNSTFDMMVVLSPIGCVKDLDFKVPPVFTRISFVVPFFVFYLYFKGFRYIIFILHVGQISVLGLKSEI
jgi:hypothetical protein